MGDESDFFGLRPSDGYTVSKGVALDLGSEGDMETLRSMYAPDAVHSAAGDDTVVATHHNTGQRNGKTLDQDETFTFTLSDGKFTRLTEQHSDPASYDAFWS